MTEITKAELNTYKMLAKSGDPIDIYNLALAHQYRGEQKHAIKNYTKSGQLGYIPAMFNLANFYRDNGKPQDAIEWYLKAAKLGDVDAMVNLANLYGDFEQIKDSLTWNRKAADLNHPVAMSNLGRQRLEMGQNLEAIEWLTKAADLGNVKALHNLGIAYLNEKKYQAASDKFLLSFNNGYNNSLVALAQTYREMGESDEAYDCFLKAAELGEATAFLALGELNVEKNNLEEAIPWITKAADLGDPEPLNLLGFVHHNLGNSEESKKFYLMAANLGHPHSMYNLALTYDDEGNEDAALAWYQKAAENGSLDALNELGDRHLSEDDIDSALECFTTTAHNDDSYGMVRLGNVYEIIDKIASAVIWWRKAAELGNTDACGHLAMYFLSNEQFDEAERWWRKGAELEDPDSMYNLALLLENEDKGSMQEILDLLNKSAELGNSFAMRSLGIHHELVTQDFELAIDWYKKAVAFDNDDARVNLINLLDELGRSDESTASQLLTNSNLNFEESTLGYLLNQLEGDGYIFELQGVVNVEGGSLTIADEGVASCDECGGIDSEKLFRVNCSACGRNEKNNFWIKSGDGDGMYPVFAITNQFDVENPPIGFCVLFDSNYEISKEIMDMAISNGSHAFDTSVFEKYLSTESIYCGSIECFDLTRFADSITSDNSTNAVVDILSPASTTWELKVFCEIPGLITGPLPNSTTLRPRVVIGLASLASRESSLYWNSNIYSNSTYFKGSTLKMIDERAVLNDWLFTGIGASHEQNMGLVAIWHNYKLCVATAQFNRAVGWLLQGAIAGDEDFLNELKNYDASDFETVDVYEELGDRFMITACRQFEEDFDLDPEAYINFLLSR